jgi:glyoxylase-like metal-dependent hydrolase (beta-lactamase superfamily II)
MPAVSLRLADDESIAIGRLRLRAIATPGRRRTRCLRGDDTVFSGDTLLIQGTGRTDLPGDAGAQYSWSGRLLPDATRVYARAPRRDGHTIAGERRRTPRLQVRCGLIHR